MSVLNSTNNTIPENGLVDVLGPVGGPHDEDGAVVVGGEPVPELHELGLDHGRGLVVVLVPHPQQAVCTTHTRRFFHIPLDKVLKEVNTIPT